MPHNVNKYLKKPKRKKIIISEEKDQILIGLVFTNPGSNNVEVIGVLLVKFVCLNGQTALGEKTHIIRETKISLSPRPISIGQLNMLPCVHLRPINHIVYVGSYLHDAMGNLILR